jgi:nucleoside-diphosphate-sugar epimerase
VRILIIGGTRFLGRHLVEGRFGRNHEVTLFNRGKSNPDLFPPFSNDPWRSRYLQRPGHYDVLVMAIRCSRVFTGQQFSNGRATVPLDRESVSRPGTLSSTNPVQ